MSDFFPKEIKEKYNYIKTIGKGGFGLVYLMEDKNDKSLIAMKEMDLNQCQDENEKKLLIQETDVLKKLDHKNIIKFKGTFHDNEKERVYIFMEYADGGDLSLLIKENKKNNIYIPMKNILNYTIQICEALQYIHSKNIIHRDLKPLNVFLTKNNEVKLGDFGVARELKSENSIAKTFVGSLCYLSPEIIENEFGYTYKTDIWALGIILYEMITLSNPFSSFKGNFQIMNKIKSGNISKIEKNDCPKELIDLIPKILRINPNERSELSQILEICKKILDDINNKEKNNTDNNNVKDNNEKEVEIINGKKEGHGSFIYKNGDKYVGDFKDDKREGKGILYYKNGNIYDGEFKNNCIDGNGTFYYKNQNKYVGEVKKNLKFGKRIFYFKNGEKYDGQFSDNEFNGKGTLYYQNNQKKYEGDFKENEFNGKGIFYFQNGDIYKGDFKDGYKDGNGILILVNGEEKNGKWERDELKN